MRIRKEIAASGILLMLVSALAFALPPFYRVTRVASLGGPVTRGVDMNNSGQVTGTAIRSGGATRAFLWNGSTSKDLGHFGGALRSEGTAINAVGQVTGIASIEGDGRRAFLWNGTVLQNLGTLGSSPSRGFAINRAGHVTGNSAVSANRVRAHAFLWNGAKLLDLGRGAGIAINASDQVTGTTSMATGLQAFLWDRGSRQLLGTLGGRDSFGSAINAAGQVTGWSNTMPLDPAFHAFLWNGTAMEDLGTLGGRDSQGLHINALGQVSGNSIIASPIEQHGFFWDGLAMKDVGTLGGTVSQAAAMNQAGQVTGFSTTPGDSGISAFVWDGISMHDLNGLIDPADSFRGRVELRQGIDINERGQILVLGYLDNVQDDQTFVLTPVLRHDLKDFTLSKPEVAGCKQLTGTITLSRAAPAGGVVVKLQDTLAAATLPMTLTIPQGQTSNTFAVSTIPVSTKENGVVIAILGGSSLQKALSVRPIGMSSVTLTPNPVVGTKNVAGTARLECKAGPGSIQVALASNNAAIAKPIQSSITVPMGVESATFTVTTSKVTANKNVTISATSNDIKISKVLTVTP